MLYGDPDRAFIVYPSWLVGLSYSFDAIPALLAGYADTQEGRSYIDWQEGILRQLPGLETFRFAVPPLVPILHRAACGNGIVEYPASYLPFTLLHPVLRGLGGGDIRMEEAGYGGCFDLSPFFPLPPEAFRANRLGQSQRARYYGLKVCTPYRVDVFPEHSHNASGGVFLVVTVKATVSLQVLHDVLAPSLSDFGIGCEAFGVGEQCVAPLGGIIAGWPPSHVDPAVASTLDRIGFRLKTTSKNYKWLSACVAYAADEANRKLKKKVVDCQIVAEIEGGYSLNGSLARRREGAKQ